MNKTFIIAEAGVNHNGSVELAIDLIDKAVECGADAIKFQTFKADKLVTKHAQKAAYQKKSASDNESQYELIKKLELDESDHLKLFRYAAKKNITFLSSPFDKDSISFLHDLGIKIFKIPSGEITNLPYLRKMAGYNRQIILSTGMSDMKEIKSALDILTTYGTSRTKVTVLHCNTDYPTPVEDVNLTAMLTIKETLKVKVGYSDHTSGLEIPFAAVALGAEVIEKHFTLDKNLAGPDHQASLEPPLFKEMVQGIRNISLAMGDGIKKPSTSELKNIKIVRKSIVASQNIGKGEIFTDRNLDTKRPGDGISPMQWEAIVGKKAVRDFKKDDLIEL